MKRALITGITGQDGSYLAELLLNKGYEVHGMIRRSSSFNTGRIDHIYRDPHEKDVRMFLHYGDLNDASSINLLLRDIQPDEIYNLGAQSHVRVSFDVPEYTGEVDALGAMRILEGIRETGLNTKFYQASSSELYGKVVETPQKETTPFYPRCPYACAKVYAFYITQSTTAKATACSPATASSSTTNHPAAARPSSPARSPAPRRASSWACRTCLYLGNLDAKRDWGFAGDYVEAMWLMLQQDLAEDYVIATGETWSVRTFAEKVFERLGMPLTWQGSGTDETGIDTKSGKVLIRVDPKYFRPAEVDLLLGDPAKAKRQLGWELKTSFDQLVDMMVDADLKQAEREKRADGCDHLPEVVLGAQRTRRHPPDVEEVREVAELVDLGQLSGGVCGQGDAVAPAELEQRRRADRALEVDVQFDLRIAHPVILASGAGTGNASVTPRCHFANHETGRARRCVRGP